MGENTFKFTISPVGNTGALIYAQNATSDALTFQVTLSDAQFSYMGRKEGSTETDEGALYAVRFTAKNGEKEYRLLTTYDEELYSGADLQKSFVLSADCLTASNLEGQKIDQATEYTMHVFAVPDFDHDGLVETDEAGSEDQLQSYEWFFGDEDNFQKMINRIWDDQGGSYTELDSMKWIKKRYEVGLKTQQTTDSEGILINEKMASILRVGTNTLQLNLAESYGVVTIDENDQARQSFPLVKWSVTGLNVPTFLSGESRVSAGDKIFTRTTDAQGYEVYTYDIPAQVTSGNYLITVQLYRSEDASAPYKTLSLTYRG